MIISKASDYALTFGLSDRDGGQEIWLIEWAIEWFECNIRELTVSRTKEDGQLHTRIDVTFNEPVDLSSGRNFRMLQRLDSQVDDLDVEWNGWTLP